MYCIESGDDLGPLRLRFGGVDWVGVDGRLTGPFFFFSIAILDFVGVVKKKFPILGTTTHTSNLEPEGHEHTRERRRARIHIYSLSCGQFESKRLLGHRGSAHRPGGRNLCRCAPIIINAPTQGFPHLA
jgi:hypothetical protein